ncbi:tyrosinase family protein [Psychroflexus sp. MES1-P1E]|uniref:tyrosinase family protein n=1 Tax=Psychroflexus sp. MES1-P1E TaxID=2058320 RepID=UPI000C7AE7C0|nr:tyrosinase family protein [Psychroflexus sp. MES1-P1E]PKG42795.1 hypothetical protein CXF67_08385 [Psychroflexus sp. MES1-P1E]
MIFTITLTFLPFHRTYLERLEDWLISQGHPEFVPLPKWTGEVLPPPEFEFAGPNGNGVSPFCGSSTCSDAPSGSAGCSSPNGWDTAIVSLPNNLTLPIISGTNNDLCDLQFNPLNYTANNDESGGSGLSRQIESPWHNQGHQFMGGVMLNFKSPAAAIFWIWHAGVDDKWKEWEQNCPQSTTLSSDLYMKDNEFVVEYYRDRGEEPNIDDGPMWTSKDIWVRNQADGVLNQSHQNPEYGRTNYVYVRVRNRGFQNSLGSEQLRLYWAKANTALTWPNHWDGSMDNDGGFSLGEPLGTLSIPQIGGQDQTIVEFAWNDVPNPDDYNIGQGSDNPHHFCLLSRIDATNDPMANEVTGSVYQNTKNNNNIAWKNLSIVDLIPGGIQPPNPCTGVFVGNFNTTARNIDLEFVLPRNYKGNPVLAEAEVLVTLDDATWDKCDTNGRQKQNLTVNKEEQKQLIINQDNASLKNLNFQANEYRLLNVCFRFLSKQMSGQKDFEFHVIQRDAATGEIIGGETFKIEVEGKEGFYADAGDDQEISQGEIADISAYSVDENAVYNWYDQDGNLIYTGLDISVSPEITKKYKLEVISNNGGIIDYDEIEIKVKEYEILGMSPNPANGQVSLNYKATNANSAYIMITQPYGNTNNYILDVNQSNVSINLANYNTGIYYAVLVCNGQVYDSRTLIIE